MSGPLEGGVIAPPRGVPTLGSYSARESPGKPIKELSEGSLSSLLANPRGTLGNALLFDWMGLETPSWRVGSEEVGSVGNLSLP